MMNPIFSRNNLQEIHPLIQFFLAIIIAIGVFCVLMFLTMPIAYLFFGSIALNLGEVTDFSNPAILPVLKFYQVVQSTGLFVIPPFVIAYFYSSVIKDYLSFNPAKDIRQFMLVVLIIFSAMPFINLLAEYNAQIKFPQILEPLEQSFKSAEQSAEKITQAFMNTRTICGLMFNLFMVAVLPAIGEELMFRGVFQRIFTSITKNAHWGIIISAFLFSAIHMQFYGFFPRWILGMIFGYLLLWSGNMWVPIFAHFVNNSFAVIGYFMVNNGRLGKETLEVGSSTDLLPFTLLATTIFMAACYYFYKLSKQT